MALSSQFSLTMELTKLLPLRAAADQALDGVIKFARDLRNTGSDIVVEADLAQFFGRCRIAQDMESTFRGAVSKPGVIRYLCEGIFLDNSAGPTVSRCLQAGNQEYFSTVVQCSLLASVHENDSLTSAIVSAMEHRSDGAPPDTPLGSIPSFQSIHGFLKACQEQTARFDWHRLLLAAGAKLKIRPPVVFSAIEKSVLSGLTLLFPYVQSLPEDRLILVHTHSGLELLVVWAHDVLGFNVLVRQGDPPEDLLFGNAPASIIFYRTARPVTGERFVTLVEASTRDRLFSIVRDPDDDVSIDSVTKRPAKGIARYLLNSDWDYNIDPFHISSDRTSCVNEMMVSSIAFSLRVSDHLERTVEYEALEAVALGPVHVRRHTLLKTAQFLFDADILGRVIADRVDSQGDSSAYDLPPPAAWTAACQLHHRDSSQWDLLFRPRIIQLSFLMLVFAHAMNPEEAQHMPLDTDLTYFNSIGMFSPIEHWNGRDSIFVGESSWFEAAAALLAGFTSARDFLEEEETMSLVSDRGWSVFLSILADSDPAVVAPGWFAVKEGVPVRNGVRKHRVVDMPALSRSQNPGEALYYRAGTTVHLSNAIPRLTQRYQCGERGDAFVVRVRYLLSHHENTIVGCTGYGALQVALWRAIRTDSCSHPNGRMDSEFTLPTSVSALVLQWDEDIRRALAETEHQVVLLLTANKVTARWRTLAGLEFFQPNVHKNDSGRTRTMLRSQDCCSECAIQQALLKPFRCFLVL